MIVEKTDVRYVVYEIPSDESETGHCVIRYGGARSLKKECLLLFRECCGEHPLGSHRSLRAEPNGKSCRLCRLSQTFQSLNSFLVWKQKSNEWVGFQLICRGCHTSTCFPGVSSPAQAGSESTAVNTGAALERGALHSTSYQLRTPHPWTLDGPHAGTEAIEYSEMSMLGASRNLRR